uniref:Uncharacterized protein n=1 Tax=Rhizophora mucronata TaxID=61149 RepID=A0A2P2P035_RHIMU
MPAESEEISNLPIPVESLRLLSYCRHTVAVRRPNFQVFWVKAR